MSWFIFFHYLGMDDPTWFWGGVEPWKPRPRQVSGKRWFFSFTVKKHIFLGVGLLVTSLWSLPGKLHTGTTTETSLSIRSKSEESKIIPIGRVQLYNKLSPKCVETCGKVMKNPNKKFGKATNINNDSIKYFIKWLEELIGNIVQTFRCFYI